jgi:outer membrane protein assembly factor BamD
MLLFMHQADTVPAATIGDPTLEDPKATVAPDVVRKAQRDVYDSVNPAAARTAPTADSAGAATADAATAPAPAASTAPLALENVPTAGAAPSSGLAVGSSAPEAAPGGASSGNSVGIEIVQPSRNSHAPATPGNTAFPGTDGANPPASGTQPAEPPATAKPNPADNGGVSAVGPPANTQLAPVQHADKAPDAINEVKPGPPAAGTQTAAADTKKNPKPAYDSDQESSSKHKPKKGLKKLNPF